MLIDGLAHGFQFSVQPVVRVTMHAVNGSCVVPFAQIAPKPVIFTHGSVATAIDVVAV